MPIFHLHFHSDRGSRADESGIEFADLEEAYLDVCASIPEAARELLLRGEDPMVCSFVIADRKGRALMTVPFTETLARKNWRLGKTSQRPVDGLRSRRARVQLARDAFEWTLGNSPTAHALIGMDFELLGFNAAAAIMTGEAVDRVLGQVVFEAFDGFQVVMRTSLEAFYGLAARGLRSDAINLVYHRCSDEGPPVTFWIKARAWPILDDDGRVLAIANCATASTRPYADGRCRVGERLLSDAP